MVFVGSCILTCVFSEKAGAETGFYFNDHEIVRSDSIFCGYLKDRVLFVFKKEGWVDFLLEDNRSGAVYRFVHETPWPFCGKCDDAQKLSRRLVVGDFYCLQQHRNWYPFRDYPWSHTYRVEKPR